MSTLILRPEFMRAITLPSSVQAFFTFCARETFSKSLAFLKVKSSRITIAVPLRFFLRVITRRLVSLDTNLQMMGRLPSCLNCPILCAMSMSAWEIRMFSLSPRTEIPFQQFGPMSRVCPGHQFHTTLRCFFVYIVPDR